MVQNIRRLKSDSYWYRYIYPKNLNLFQSEKLVAPEISLGGNFSYDKNGGFYSTTKIYGYIKKCTTKESYKFWLALLNSSLFWFFIKQTGYVLRGGYFTFKTNYIYPFPVPKNISISEVKFVEKMVDEIIGIRNSSLKDDISKQEKAIDEVFYNIYDISKNERRTIERDIFI
ncbi:MAG: TaqI-like C-terminal specificity domain-containing protein [Cyclobacteriaceae bacterium]